MKLMEDEHLVDRAAEQGDRIVSTVRDADIGCVREVRGKGMLIGIQLAEDRSAKDVLLACMDRGLIICIAKNNVVRLAPALTTPQDLLDAGVEILIDVLKA